MNAHTGHVPPAIILSNDRESGILLNFGKGEVERDEIGVNSSMFLVDNFVVAGRLPTFDGRE